jgi:serine/threonine protein phosphatase 1
MTEGRTIAIGDVHGCSAALAALLAAIDLKPIDTLVFLGDTIDRGPDSRGVLDQLLQLERRCTVVPLMGNHEQMLLEVLEGREFRGWFHRGGRFEPVTLTGFVQLQQLRGWLQVGGRELIASYGYPDGVEIEPGPLRDLVPAEHLAFIHKCRDCFETAHHFFVHAYYDPDRSLFEQPWDRLRWTGLPAAPAPHCSGKVAVVGHTEQASGELLDLGFLKCLDTHCYRDGGWLTALEVTSNQVWQVNLAGELRTETR